ncbi:Rrf2 family transcriptional regulator [Chryseobacterium sp.]|uniref:Rrf2 family transcriptional regulator n=1 Tax=Chryseobacterium sp. TaxID=1871047 RepID=UPI00388DBFB4
MNNTRFSTALHIMTLLGQSEDEVLTSEWMAGSININPVVVRKELGFLKEAGLVISRKGKVGGSLLSRNPEKISLADIYNAVKNSEVLGKKNNQPNPSCSIGKNINFHLNELFVETDQMVIQFLGKKNLKDFIDQFV